MRIFVHGTDFTGDAETVSCVDGGSTLQSCLPSQVRDSNGTKRAVIAGLRDRVHVRNKIKISDYNNSFMRMATTVAVMMVVVIL